jgi:hypothetical protein
VPVESLALSYTLLLESDGNLVIYPTDKVPFTGTLKLLFKVHNPLVQVQVEWQCSCFDFEELYRHSPVYPTHCLEVLGLDGGKVTGNSLGLLLSRVVPHSSTISYSATDNLCVYFSGTEQAIPLHGHGEPSEDKLLGSELPFYSIKVALLLEFTVDPDSKKPGFLD